MSEQNLKNQIEGHEQTMKDYEDQFDIANPWCIVQRYMDDQTDLHLKIEGIVNSGVIVKIEGLRGFIPASKLSLSYVDQLEDYLLQDIDVRVIDVDPAEHRLVLSAREILKEREEEKRKEQLSSIEVGSVLEGTVDSIQTYGAFVRLPNDLSGLVHISQISEKRIRTPEEVLKTGDTVKVKVIGIKNGKISLSMKALEVEAREAEEHATMDLPQAEDIGTSLGDLFKQIQF